MRYTQKAVGVRRRRIWAVAGGAALGLGFSTLAVPASAVELDSNGFALITVEGTPGATELWIEVEDPALSAAETFISVDDRPVTVIDTALGAAAIVKAGAEDLRVAIAVSINADPDIAFTAVDAEGTRLYSEHYRTAMTASRPGGTQPGTPASEASPTQPPAGAAPSDAPSPTAPAAGEQAGEVKTQGDLASTGAQVLGLLLAGVAALSIGLIVVATIRRKAQA